MPTLTLQNLMDRVYARLDGNTVLYSPDQITSAINEAYRLTNIILGYQQTSVPLLSIANRIWYDVPDPIIIPTRVQFENVYLQPTSVNTLGRSNANWTTANTDTEGTAVTNWIQLGLRKFGLFPADANGGGLIMITGVSQITPLSSPSDTVNWSADILSAFDNYATHILQLRESDEIFEQASLDYMAYQASVKEKTYIQGFKMPFYYIASRQPTNR